MKTLILLSVLLFVAIGSQAKLIVQVDDPKASGQKSVIKLTLKNTFAEKIESARAQIFLMTDDGKMVGQKTAWVIGGTKDRPPLESNKETTYNFVIETDKTFTKTKVSFSRLILEGGKTVDASREIEIIP